MGLRLAGKSSFPSFVRSRATTDMCLLESLVPLQHPSASLTVLSVSKHSLTATHRALDDAAVRAHIQIAECYLQLGSHRLARVYVERIYHPLNTWDSRNNRQKFPLELKPDSNLLLYAELLEVAARISLACGNDGSACTELHAACRLDPDNVTIQRLLEQCTARLNERSTRRGEKQQQQRGSARRKLDGRFLHCLLLLECKQF